MGADITILTAGTLTDRGQRALPMPTGVARLLKLGSRLRVPAGSALARVWELFDMPPPENFDYPVAALEYLGRSRSIPAGWPICADLVHLRPEGGRLYLVTGDCLDVEQADGDTLFRELEDHFADRGWRWSGFDATHAVVCTPAAARIRTHPPDAIAGEDVDAYLPHGPDARDWHGYMNECQMRLHACAINEARERAEVPTVNSIWFWGGGGLPAAPQSTPWDLVFTQEPLFRGLAEVAGAQTVPLPDSMDALLARVPEGRRALLVCCDLRSLVRVLDREQGAALLGSLDETWVSPAMCALKEGQLRALTVSDAAGGEFVLTAHTARRWWRAWRWKRTAR